MNHQPEKRRDRAIFLDKDGTLIEDVPYNVDPALISLSWQAGAALQMLQGLGYKLIVVTNQSGVARGLFTEAALGPVQRRLAELLAQYGVALDGFYYCPHSPEGAINRYAISCTCRKPMPGMLTRAAHEHGIDLSRSWMIGDILNDVEAGKRAGCRTIHIDNGNETEWEISPLRTPDLSAADMMTAAHMIAALNLAEPAGPDNDIDSADERESTAEPVYVELEGYNHENDDHDDHRNHRDHCDLRGWHPDSGGALRP